MIIERFCPPLPEEVVTLTMTLTEARCLRSGVDKLLAEYALEDEVNNDFFLGLERVLKDYV